MTYKTRHTWIRFTFVERTGRKRVGYATLLGMENKSNTLQNAENIPSENELNSLSKLLHFNEKCAYIKLLNYSFFNDQFDSNLINLIERKFIKFHLNTMTYDWQPNQW